MNGLYFLNLVSKTDIRTVPDPVAVRGHMADPVPGPGLDQASQPTAKGGRAARAPPRHPPSWLSPAHSPGCSRPPHCRARNDMAVPLNVVIIDNDRGDSPSSYRAHALGAGAQPQGGGRWLASSTVVPGVSWLSYYHSLKSSLFIRAVLSGGRRLQPKQNDKCGVWSFQFLLTTYGTGRSYK